MNAGAPQGLLLAPLLGPLLLAACASSPVYGPSDDQALGPFRLHVKSLQNRDGPPSSGSPVF